MDRCASSINCTLNDTNAGNYPDVPWDLNCTGACTDKPTPTFWITKRLRSITTQVYSGTAYSSVERVDIGHVFPDNHDSGATKPQLWMADIDRTGLVGGTKALPGVRLDGTYRANRVDFNVGAGSPAMNKWRVFGVLSDTGGYINVTYTAAECTVANIPQGTADHNQLRCFPMYWTPTDGGAAGFAWFHRYTVASVEVSDQAAGSPTVKTTYYYDTKPGWAYNYDLMLPQPQRTWSDYRGYGKFGVVTGTGAGSTATDYLIFRGLHGDHNADGSTDVVPIADSEGGSINDEWFYQGFVRETQHLTARSGGTVLAKEIDDPTSWQSAWDDDQALAGRITELGKNRGYTRLLDTSTWRKTATAYTCCSTSTT